MEIYELQRAINLMAMIEDIEGDPSDGGASLVDSFPDLTMDRFYGERSYEALEEIETQRKAFIEAAGNLLLAWDGFQAIVEEMKRGEEEAAASTTDA